MARRVQADAHAEVIHPLAITQGLQRDVTEARTQHALGRRGSQVVAVAAARMIGMGMRDHGAMHRPPWVDVEVAGRAIQAFGALNHEVVGTGQRGQREYRRIVGRSAGCRGHVRRSHAPMVAMPAQATAADRLG